MPPSMSTATVDEHGRSNYEKSEEHAKTIDRGKPTIVEPAARAPHELVHWSMTVKAAEKSAKNRILLLDIRAEIMMGST